MLSADAPANIIAQPPVPSVLARHGKMALLASACAAAAMAIGWSLGWVACATFLVGSGFTFALTRQESEPLLALDNDQQLTLREDIAHMAEAIKAMSAGNFQIDKHGVRSTEIRPLGDALNAMTSKLQGQVENLQWLAQHDTLTNLPNRKHFQRMVEAHLADDAADGRVSGLLFVDVDKFKTVNDTLGHRVGDHVLQLIADRIKLVVRADLGLVNADISDDPADRTALERERPTPFVGRLGGDEFTIFLPDCGDVSHARRMGARVLRVLSEPCELGPQSIQLGGSIGLAMSPTHASTYDELIRAADTAMYHAKKQGRNRLEMYSEQLDQKAREMVELEQELREALAREQFILHFQPQFDCRNRQIRAVEALVRWNHPQRGIVMPNDFIPIAEQVGLINEIGERVISEAVKAIARWHEAGLPMKVAVNVSPTQFRRVEFLALVKACIQKYNAPSELLELEITESVIMQEDALTNDRMRRLQELGVSIAIDDFGTGYSNLSRLMRLPIDSLKIDRSLLQPITTQPEARTLVQMIVGMANGLGMQSIAEGVEESAQMDMLAAMGCDMAQGFLLSMPLSEQELGTFARSIRKNGLPDIATVQAVA